MKIFLTRSKNTNKKKTPLTFFFKNKTKRYT